MWWVIALTAAAAAAQLWWGSRRVKDSPPPDRGATPVRFPAVVAGMGLGVVVAWFFDAPVVWWPPAAVAGSVVGAVIGKRLPDQTVRRRHEQVIVELPMALELLAACVRSGSPLRQAVAEVARVGSGPVADDLTQLVRAVDLGTAESGAWRALQQSPGWSSVAGLVAAALESGTTVAPSLQRAAEDSRRVARSARITAARTVGVRSVLPLMICYLPAFLLVGVVPVIGSFIVQLPGL